MMGLTESLKKEGFTLTRWSWQKPGPMDYCFETLGFNGPEAGRVLVDK